MAEEPCKVCGNTEMNLVDGFYYCVECGTQDANVMETLIEDVKLSDGTYAIRRKTKINKVVRAVEKVPPEWHKWQAYNYILAGMVKEVMDLGAGPKFKMRVMWLWTLFVRKFQKKKELGLSEEDDEIIGNTRNINIVFKKCNATKEALKYNLCKTNVNLLVTIIYLALNFDRSEILVSDLVRFIREGRLSSRSSIKYLPEEIDVSVIEGFKLFHRTGNPNVEYTNIQAMTVIKTLELGPPIVPDLRKIAERFIKELCLPEEFNDLVLSLMHYVSCDYLDIDKFIMKQMTSVPFYEAKIMAYILVALKMCFGLDDHYENKLSDAVDQINSENCHMKCYKLGAFSTSSDRLFSFREWIKFLQLRRLVLSRCYLPFANLYHMDVDDFIYMEQRYVPIPFRKHPSLTDDIIMSIIEKLTMKPRKEVIPKSAFLPTLTPLTTYTDVILQHHHDPEIKLLLAEDFKQYSLKYACEDLELRMSDNSENIVVGVDETNLCVKDEIQSKVSSSVDTKRDSSLVYIRNCENKHWLKTNPPTKDHIKKIKRDSNEDSGNIRISETSSFVDESVCDDISDDDNNDKKLEFIDEDKSGNIFDDDFNNFEEYEEKSRVDLSNVKQEPIERESIENNSQNGDRLSNVENPSLNPDGLNLLDDEGLEYFFNPETFDREGTIKELVLLTCKKYAIAVPKEYTDQENKEPRKRKAENVKKENTDEGASEEKPKKKRVKAGEAQAQVDVLLSAYYDSLRHEVFSTVTHHIRDLVEDLERTQANLNTEHQVDGDISNIIDNHNEFTDGITSNDDNINDGQAEDPSLVEIENQTLDDSVIEEAINAYRGDPKFDDKIYDVRQLYVKMPDDNEEDIFDIGDDPDIARIISKKMDEPEPTENFTKDSKRNDSFNNWDDEIPLSDLKEQMVRTEKRKAAFKKLQYLVSNRENLIKNNYWVRQERIMTKVMNRSDSFTNELKETFPSSFSFLIIECAAMLDCTPFILYKFMLQIEEFLIPDV